MFRRLLNGFKQKGLLGKSRKGTVIYAALILVLSMLIYLTYDEYKKTIVNQQQQQMLSTSKSISRSIELFIEDIVDGIKIITLDREFIKSISDIQQLDKSDVSKTKLKAYHEAEGKTIDAVYLFDKNGRMLIEYPEAAKNISDSVQSEIDMVINKKKNFIGQAYFDKDKNSFVLNIYEPVYDEEKLTGVIAVGIRLDVIYDILIAPVKIGEKGYAMVKDQKGIIIMHPVKEQVGMDVIETRKQLYPNLDFRELESLIEDQLRGGEGTALYHSYWWGDNILKKAKKLSAYAPVQFGEHFWVVALTMSYDEIQGPINKFLGIIIGIAGSIAVIIYIFIAALLRMRKNKEELEKETKYLKMLNEASEQLRKKEAELYHSHKLKMIGTLAGGIAHDINNLLTPIYGYAELLLMRIPQDSEYYEEVDEILKASQKGKELIEQILLFSRNDNGTAKSELININEAIKETIKLVKAVLPKNVVIKEDIKADGNYIKANFAQIHQVVFNLCTNAYQAIKNKKGVIEISCRSISGIKANGTISTLSGNRNYVELTVRDTGCGMDEETKERIFDPFFTTKAAGDGTGLGLFVVQSIIDKYEGAITVESEIGNGSSFKVFLPLIAGEIDAEQSDIFQSSESDGKRILIVDDNEDIIKMLRKGLEHLGYEIVSETDSERALKIFQSDYRKIDLVITDYMMPGLKGNDLAAAVKDIKGDARVILMSGYMGESREEMNNSQCIDAYISKPIELSGLSDLINRLSLAP